ncbi:unnamed protein product, partial [Didymodactylos carnosus]
MSSIESLIEELEEYHDIIQIWDELNTFTSTMGLYRAEKATYDRSFFNMFFNGEKEKRRQTCRKSRVLKNPKLNIACGGQPGTAILAMTEDPSVPVTQDGLFSRFLVAAPEARAPRSSDFKKLNQNIPGLKHLLFTVHMLHVDDARNYYYSDDAKNVVKSKFDIYTDIINGVSRHDTFLASLYGKAQIMIDRLAAILHVCALAGTAL